jgi:uncharacterized lipoprotein YmbA
MRVIALLLAFMLTGCTVDQPNASTKCDEVSAVLSDPSSTHDQVAKAMETVEITSALACDRVALGTSGGVIKLANFSNMAPL